jgi:hypothetical protein
MDGFLAPRWNLEQVRAWALSRDADVVRRADQSPMYGDAESPVRIAIRTARAAVEARQRERDINDELWKASGLLPFDRDNGGLQVILYDDEVGRAPAFPIDDHILSLLRSGQLVASGSALGETVPRRLEGLEWEDRDFDAFNNLRFERDAVLVAFPANAPVKTATDLNEISAGPSSDLSAEPTPKAVPLRGAKRPSKPQAMAKWLVETYGPERPPHSSSEFMAQMVANAPELPAPQAKSFERALKIAWPRLEEGA